jgi:hypothetical protein
MARPKTLKPKYCLNKIDGRAFVTLSGKRKYLGNHGTQASRDEYDRVVGEWIATGRQGAAGRADQPVGTTVSTVIAAFWTHAQTYYAACIRQDGKVTGELDNYRLALKPLRRLYGATPAEKTS